MGCICSKAKSANDYVADNHHKELKANISSKHLGRGDTVVTENDATARLISNVGNEASMPASSESDEGDKEKEKDGATCAKPLVRTGSNWSFASGGQPRISRIPSVTRGERGAQVLAGWPSWLTAVAGEAINGWVPRRADSFKKLDKASFTFSLYYASIIYTLYPSNSLFGLDPTLALYFKSLTLIIFSKPHIPPVFVIIIFTWEDDASSCLGVRFTVKYNNHVTGD